MLWCPVVVGSRQSISQWLVVGEDGENTTLEDESEVPDASNTGPQLVVKRAPIHLGGRQLLLKETEKNAKAKKGCC